ncbi:MAG: ABC transporter permease [Acidobacteriota bacterium]|nr:ABC transporter permease [Acidobacteriota bacterium]
MLAWSARRLAGAVVLVVLVALGSALVAQLVPGDARDLLAEGTRRGASARAPDPAASPWRWLAGAARGDLGQSLKYRQPVAALIAERIPRTLALTVSGVAIQLLVGLGAGLVLAARRGKWYDGPLSSTLYVLDAVPAFWLGIMLILVFAVQLGWLPISGTTGDPFAERTLFEELAERARHLVLPALTLGLGGAAVIARFLRNSLLDALSSGFVLAARAEGIPERRVVLRSAFRASLLPLITIFGLSFPGLLGGAVIVERVFGWPGIGDLAADAVFSRDVPVIMGTNLMFAVLVVAGNLVADALYAAADPRIRLGRSER